MNYEEKYNKALERARKLHSEPTSGTERIVCEQIFPELIESEDKRIRKALTTYFQSFPYRSLASVGIGAKDVVAWLEKQGEKTNPYSGISFEYNGHTWGMCARDNGVDILLDCKLINHLEEQGLQNRGG